jgi:hypothetical protein
MEQRHGTPEYNDDNRENKILRRAGIRLHGEFFLNTKTKFKQILFCGKNRNALIVNL